MVKSPWSLMLRFRGFLFSVRVFHILQHFHVTALRVRLRQKPDPSIFELSRYFLVSYTRLIAYL